MGDLRFGWHMPSCPVDGSSASVFLDQLQQALAHLHRTSTPCGSMIMSSLAHPGCPMRRPIWNV